MQFPPPYRNNNQNVKWSKEYQKLYRLITRGPYSAVIELALNRFLDPHLKVYLVNRIKNKDLNTFATYNWVGKSISMYESRLLDAMPDEDLPLHVAREWLPPNQKKFEKRLKSNKGV